MKLHVFSGIAALMLCLNAWGQAEVRLAVHKTFKLPKETIARFEKANDAKVSVITAGSGNEMLNKLILSKANPIADAVYGLDNANIGKARQAGILAERQPESAPVSASMPVSRSITTKNGLRNTNWRCPKPCRIWPNPNIKTCWSCPTRPHPAPA